MNYPSETSRALDKAREELCKKSSAYYLFQPASRTRLSKLSRKKLWMSDPEKFNDPLDLKLGLEHLSYRGPYEEDRLRNAMQVLLSDNSKAPLHWFYNEGLLQSVESWIGGQLSMFILEDQIKGRFREFGVACFTPIWNNGLMWSHYASSHAGYCVEYRVKEIDLNTRNEGVFSSFHVQYSSTLPTFCVSEALFAPHQFLGRMLATKSAEWAYEQEWRVVHLEKKAAFVDMPKGIEISALIAGLKADEKLLAKLTQKAAALKIPAYQVERVSGYELKMVLL